MLITKSAFLLLCVSALGLTTVNHDLLPSVCILMGRNDHSDINLNLISQNLSYPSISVYLIPGDTYYTDD